MCKLRFTGTVKFNTGRTKWALLDVLDLLFVINTQSSTKESSVSTNTTTATAYMEIQIQWSVARLLLRSTMYLSGCVLGMESLWSIIYLIILELTVELGMNSSKSLWRILLLWLAYFWTIDLSTILSWPFIGCENQFHYNTWHPQTVNVDYSDDFFSCKRFHHCFFWVWTGNYTLRLYLLSSPGFWIL